MTIAFLAALLALNVALRAWPLRRHGDAALTAVECAFLRGGIKAAVLTALAIVHVSHDPDAPVRVAGATRTPSGSARSNDTNAYLVANSYDDGNTYGVATGSGGSNAYGEPTLSGDNNAHAQGHAAARAEAARPDDATGQTDRTDPEAEDGDPCAGDDPYRSGEDPFERAVAGDAPAGNWRIARTRRVRAAAAEVRERLVADGLFAPTGHWAIARCALLAVPVVAAIASVNQLLDLSAVITSAVAILFAVMLWLAPRRTIAGWRVLRAERRRYERVTLAQRGAPADPGAVGMLVALHGRPAFQIVLQRSTPSPQPPPAATLPPAVEETPERTTPDSMVEAGEGAYAQRTGPPAEPDAPGADPGPKSGVTPEGPATLGAADAQAVTRVRDVVVSDAPDPPDAPDPAVAPRATGPVARGESAAPKAPRPEGYLAARPAVGSVARGQALTPEAVRSDTRPTSPRAVNLDAATPVAVPRAREAAAPDPVVEPDDVERDDPRETPAEDNARAPAAEPAAATGPDSPLKPRKLML